jgi:hypothetical protein
MTTERFNELLAGPLAHPMPMFTISRLALALKHVVDETGAAGAHALEVYCDLLSERDARDSQDDEEAPEDDQP